MMSFDVVQEVREGPASFQKYGRRLYYFLRDDLTAYPPAVAQVLIMSSLGVQVSAVVGACDDSLARTLRSAGVSLTVVGNQRHLQGMAGKVESYASFRARCGKLSGLSNLPLDAAVWLGSADTAMALTGMFRNRRLGVSVLELYDQYPVYLRMLKRILPVCNVVVCSQETRADLMRIQFGLERRPLVMPNKPYSHPRVRSSIGSSPERKAAIDAIRSPRILLYQGLIAADRSLLPLAHALNAVNGEWTLALMGPTIDESPAEIERIYPPTVYLGNFPAPTHLEVTSHALVGVAYYEPNSLNNLFCAPNKIFEYAGFGIPILANRVPGLIDTVGRWGAGECVDFFDAAAVSRALTSLTSEYSRYSAAATRMFESVDNVDVIRGALSLLFGED